MEPWAWILTTVLIAIISAIATFVLTRMRMEANIAELKSALAKAQAILEAERKSSQETVRATEEAARRNALDEFLKDMRVEERHYVRQSRLLFATRRSLVMQERMYFRNIPLSNWVEHEVPIEEGADVDDVAKTLSIFDRALELDAPKSGRGRKLLFG
jgi:hypothetical protein